MSVNFGEMAVFALRHRNKKLADNVTNHNALLMRLDKKGKKRPVSGGRSIVEELEYAENGTVAWYSGFDELDITPQVVFDAAEYDWKQLAGTVSISGLEQIKVSGKDAIFNLLEKRLDNLERSLKNQMASAVYSDGSTATQIAGLRHLIQTDPTSASTVGGIPQQTYSFWRNQIVDGTTSANIRAKMNELWIDCIRGTDKPDLILSDSVFYRYLEATLTDQQRFTNGDLAKAGFEALKFKTADVVYDDQCPASTMFFLNTDYLYLRPHKDREFSPLDRRESLNQDASVVPVVWAGAMTCSNRSLQGRLTA